MKLSIFKKYILDVIREGNRLQKVNIKGEVTQKRKFTDTQIIALIISLIVIFLFPKGVSENFAGFTISFMGIFIGLFTTLVISLFEKSQSLFNDYKQANEESKPRIKMIRNYIVQFTGLTSYSILLALILVLLLFGPLLSTKSMTNIYNYSFVDDPNEINLSSILCFLKIAALSIYRFFISYFLINFFLITIFSLTSYFSYLHSEYKKLGEKL